MKIQLITPIVPHTITGNYITAFRIKRLFKRLGHSVQVAPVYQGKKDEDGDLLIALHALRSAESIQRFKDRYPYRPIVLMLTGTDLYRDIKINPIAQTSLELADKLVLLQRMGLRDLPKHLHKKTEIIYQSASKLSRQQPLSKSEFNISLIGNLRPEKDPFRIAEAVKLLPASSRIKVTHMGGVLDRTMEKLALEESASNSRYKWIGQRSYHQTRRALANGHLLAITSIMEGSPSVLSEAIVSDVPVICSKIPSLIGTLGENYPGYFTVGDAEMLANLLMKVEQDQSFYLELKNHCEQLKSLVSPENELRAWHQLFQDIDRELTVLASPGYSSTPTY